jgi:hypothetical protein
VLLDGHRIKSLPSRLDARDLARLVAAGPGTYQVSVEPGITVTVPRTASGDIRRHKASNYNPEVPPGLA